MQNDRRPLQTGESPTPNLLWPARIDACGHIVGVLFASRASELAISDDCQHWFVIPVLLCGILTGLDALKWVQGRVDVLDPIGVLGLLSWHVFFLAPLLHVIWDWWMPFVIPPQDWRPWIGEMAWWNLAGWLIYLIARNSYELAVPLRPAQTVWHIMPHRFLPLLAIALAGAGILQVFIYAMFGGIMGYMQSYIHEADRFVGLGWLFMFAEVFPILALFGAIYWSRTSPTRRTWLVLGLMLAGFFVLKILFGGLRGSRGHTIYGVFWGVGIIHLLVRPFPKNSWAWVSC